MHLANTVATQQYDGLKYRDDTSDARWLAKLLRLCELPEGHIYPKEDRAMRDLLRKRSTLVQQATHELDAIGYRRFSGACKSQGLGADLHEPPRSLDPDG